MPGIGEDVLLFRLQSDAVLGRGGLYRVLHGLSTRRNVTQADLRMDICAENVGLVPIVHRIIVPTTAGAQNIWDDVEQPPESTPVLADMRLCLREAFLDNYPEDIVSLLEGYDFVFIEIDV